MSHKIGLLVVHGIGRQCRGTLARKISANLSDDDVKPIDLIDSVEVGASNVFVTEAYWADISDPDNVPEIRSAKQIIREFLDTVSIAWSSTFSAESSSGRDVYSARRLLLLTGTLMLAGMLAIAQPQNGNDALTTSLGFLFFVLFAVYMYRYTRERVRRGLAYARVQNRFYAVIIATVLAIVFVPLSYVSLLGLAAVAEFLVILFGICCFALLCNYVLLLPVLVSQDISTLLGVMKWEFARTWLHRFTWVVILLPYHSFLQVVKGWSNLVSVTFTSKLTAVRIYATLGVFGVFLAFLVLMILCELIIAPFVALFFPVEEDFGTAFVFVYPIVSLAWILLYAGFIKLLLSGIDLILDVGNYHLADERERQRYFRSIDDGVARLVDQGAAEIHVLAHSLGTVIVYDWLQSNSNPSVPMTVLHTIGSPLDKFWYLDHSRRSREADRIGLRSNGSVLWINYYAWSDLISGHLDHYTVAHGEIENRRLRWLGILLTSHIRYWDNRDVLERVRQAMVRFASITDSSSPGQPIGDL